MNHPRAFGKATVPTVEGTKPVPSLPPSTKLLCSFAEAAMQGLLASGEPRAPTEIAFEAWRQADYLMQAMPDGLKRRLHGADQAWIAVYEGGKR